MDQRLEFLFFLEAVTACGVCLFTATENLIVGNVLSVEQAIFIICFSFGMAVTFLKVADIIKGWIKKSNER